MNRLRRTPGRRALAAVSGVLIGATVLTACDWTTVTSLESEGWTVAPESDGSITLEVSSRRPVAYADEGDWVLSLMNRGGALRFQVGDGEGEPEGGLRADYLQHEVDGTPLSAIDRLAYSIGVLEDAGNAVRPTIELDVTSEAFEGTRTYVLDVEDALADPVEPDVTYVEPTDEPAVTTAALWEHVLVESIDQVWWTEGAELPVSLDELPADAAIASGDGEGIHIVVQDEGDEVADGYDGYVDGLLLLSEDENAPLGAGWDFEVPSDTVPVRPGSLQGWVTSGPGVSFVDGPRGSEDLAYGLPGQDEDSVRFAGENLLEYVGTDRYDRTPLDTVGTLGLQSFFSGECTSPWVSVGVAYPDPEDLSDVPATDHSVLLGHQCLSFMMGAPTAMSTAEPADVAAAEVSEPEGAWVETDATRFMFFDAASGEPVTIDSFLEAHPGATISSVEFDEEDVPEELGGPVSLPGIAIHGGIAVQELFYGVEGAATVPPAYAGSFTLGQIGDTRTATYDFGPTPSGGGGGTPGYVVDVPAGGGTRTVALPGGKGSITISGNQGGGTFSLVPGGDPVGTPVNFQVLGQSWDIRPPAGFTFERAEVCLPYDEEALQAAGYTEDDLALVHYGDDGSLEDITTSIDTVNDVICGETTSFSPFAVGILDVDRLAGTDRAGTAAAISAATFAPGVDVAYVATGAGFADALSGGASAAHLGGPVLLVDATGVPSSTAAELARLRPGRIVVLGGTAAVGDGVVTALGELTDGAVTRVAGTERYATSAAVSAATFADGADVVYVATGQQFADALTGGAAAARDSAPMLLVGPDSIPAAVAAELARLDPSRIVLLGGTQAVSQAVAQGLGEIAPVDRLSGVDRYATAAAIAETFEGPVDAAFVATGTSFPDALTGVPAAAAASAPILLADGSLPAATRAVVGDLDPMALRILGGTAAVADAVVDALRDAMLN